MNRHNLREPELVPRLCLGMHTGRLCLPSSPETFSQTLPVVIEESFFFV
ncbi:Uncharacterized protein dnm_059620 [Desulfonema magnum]|uniref:Uncharacterized protein n=1 Tax=Desulfonema magnum TaxID=45655 RepID=A0A975BQS6_9BACT|nr:Uncharacterized protein dnm_059620 [Desulfonema magnum]